MSYFYDRLKAHIKQLSPPMTFYKLHFLSEVGTSQFSAWKTGRRQPSDTDIKRLAQSGIGLDEDTLFAWRAIDEYSAKTLQIAVQELQTNGLLTPNK
jgi:hypothetical protein